LFLLPQDMAKLSYLYLRKGEWDGKQVIPASWVERARAGPIDGEYGLRYANLWWSLPGGGAYFAWGAHDQLIIVVPDSDIVAVLTATSWPTGTISPNHLVDYLVKCVRADKDLPPDFKGESRLNSALQSAATEHRDEVEEPPPLAQQISGKSFDFDDNALRLKTLSLNLIGPNPTWSLSREKSATDKTVKTASGPIGLDGVYPAGPSQEGVPIAKGRWLSGTSFEAQSRVLGDGAIDKWVFEFQGAAVDLHFEDNEGNAAEARGTMRQ
jgi:hypothetical protein